MGPDSGFTLLIWPLGREDPDDAFSSVPYEKVKEQVYYFLCFFLYLLFFFFSDTYSYSLIYNRHEIRQIFLF